MRPDKTYKNKDRVARHDDEEKNAIIIIQVNLNGLHAGGAEKSVTDHK